MRLLAMLVLLGALCTPACNSASCGSKEQEPPPGGQVLTTCGQGGSIVVSLGAKQGVRPGSVLYIVRGSTPVGTMIVHSSNETQSAGTPYGDSTNASIQVGDRVYAEQ